MAIHAAAFAVLALLASDHLAQLALIAACSLAASFALTHLASRLWSRRLTEMAAAAQRLGAEATSLRAQLSQDQAIHESMSNGMIALDQNHRIISINRAARDLLGLGPTEKAAGRLLQELLREPELNSFVNDAMQLHAQDGRAKPQRELRLRSKTRATLQVSSEPLWYPGSPSRESGGGEGKGEGRLGEPGYPQRIGMLLSINDVTELRRLEAMRSDFAANVSHELRTPITNIKGYVETLLEVGVGDQTQTLQFLQVIHRNTARLAAIVEDLLALAHLEQPLAKATLERAPANVQRLIDAAVSQFESEIRAKAMKIEIDAPQALMINVNAQLVEQAIGNLLSNAIKYSPADSAIELSAREANESDVALAVKDHGPGIPQEHLTRIFERFYRVDRARSREAGGTGLGLAIVKHIALVHGGRVEVESALGRGSTFRIILPKDDETADSSRCSPPRPRLSPHRMRE